MAPTTTPPPEQELEAREAQARCAGDHLLRIAVAAPPDTVRALIGHPERWWTTKVYRESDELTVSFGHGWTRFRVDGLDWAVIAQDEPGLPSPHEWVGTTLSFRVYPDARGGSVLSFVHHGLTEQLECIELCRAGWERCLPGSLKPLAESGQGHPRMP